MKPDNNAAKRAVEKRTQAVLDALTKLGDCGQRHTFKGNERDRIEGVITERLSRTMARFDETEFVFHLKG